MADTVIKRFKDYFSMAPTPEQDERWQVKRINDSGTMTMQETGGQLVVNMGVVPNEELHLISKETFTIPCILEIPINMSQRIANQEVIIEMVSVDGETMEPDEQNQASWRFDGTTADRAYYSVNNGGMAPTNSGAQTTAAHGGSSFATFGIQLRPNEVNFGNQALDTTGQWTQARRQQNIPHYGRLYKIRIRFRNWATAPASNTVVKLQYVSCFDYEERFVDLANVGWVSGASSLPVTTTNSAYRVTGVTPADARATSAVTSSSGDVAIVPYLFNGVSYDRQRAGNTLETLLTSGARTTTQTLNFTNYQGKGIQVMVDVTALTAGAILTVKLQGKNVAGTKAFDIRVAPTQITATGFYVYEFYPHGMDITKHDGFTDIMNTTVPRSCNVVISVANANSVTYSVDVATIN